jgi:hypothetical protein
MSSQSPRRPEAPDDRFDAAFRSWAERPPRTGPEEAAGRLAPRLPERLSDRRSRWVHAARRPAFWLAAAAVLLALSLGLFMEPPGSRWGRRPPAAAAAPPAAVPLAPAGDVLVLDLDPETTLYMTLGGPLDLEAPAAHPREAPGEPSGDPS